jgi:hypothetical protein
MTNSVFAEALIQLLKLLAFYPQTDVEVVSKMPWQRPPGSMTVRESI